MYQNITINAGQSLEFFELSDFFRLLEANNALNIKFYMAGREIASVTAAEGYSERFGESFDKIRIESQTTQAVEFVLRMGNSVSYDKPAVGADLQGLFVQSQKTVTSASGQILAAKPTRRYLLIQNNDSSGDVFVTLDGSAATTTNGLKIAPGGSYELQGFANTSAINAIGSIASNANIVTVEG